MRNWPYIETIEDVISSQLCTGCGICEYLEPNVFRMDDTYKYGRRPFVFSDTSESGVAFSACPGHALKHDSVVLNDEHINKDLLAGWGPIYSVWEGYAADPEIRFAGSSGGATTALALFALESNKTEAILHTAAKDDAPYLNETVISNNRSDLLGRTGSRYAPSSPCDGLNDIEKLVGNSVFIGKPCDVAALSQARKINATLDDKIDFTISFFCAGVPSLEGNIQYLYKNGIYNLDTLSALKYRGEGWPGHWKATYKNIENVEMSTQKTYAESWGYLQKYRQWRCYICPDHTGEFSDIAVGDPWYREIKKDEPGKSLIIARTKKGLDIIKEAEAAGYLTLERNEPNLLPLSQPNLLATRGALWARLLVLRLCGAAVPNYSGFTLFKFWLQNLSFREKLQSISGTVKRVFVKRLYKHIIVSALKKKS